jgi:hypothetical protein
MSDAEHQSGTVDSSAVMDWDMEEFCVLMAGKATSRVEWATCVRQTHASTKPVNSHAEDMRSLTGTGSKSLLALDMRRETKTNVSSLYTHKSGAWIRLKQQTAIMSGKCTLQFEVRSSPAAADINVPTLWGPAPQYKHIQAVTFEITLYLQLTRCSLGGNCCVQFRGRL